MVHGVTDDQLRAAVGASRSWRGVLSLVGRTSPRVGRDLKARCDTLGIDYAHFRAGPDDSVVRHAITTARTWTEAVALAGYERESGSARAQLRKRCALLGLSIQHLETRAVASHSRPVRPLLREHLRDGGPALVAAYLLMSGCRVSWPLKPAPYDLVAEDDAGVRRVQVKTTTVRAAGSWECGLTRSVYDGAAGHCVTGHYTRGEIDAFGIVDGDLAVYVIPFDLLEGRVTAVVSRYREFRLAFDDQAGGSIG